MSERTRRSFLSAVGALAAGGVAGCLGRGDGPGSGDGSPTGSGGTPTGTPVADPLRWRTEFEYRVAGPPAVTDDAVYVAAAPGADPSATPSERSGTVAALDPADGSDRWRETTSPPPIGAPRAGAEGVYVVVGGSNAYTGEANQLAKFGPGGERRWRTDPVDQFLSTLAMGPDRVYLGTHDDAIDEEGQRLFGVDRERGDPDWTVESGDAWGGWIRDGTLFVDSGGLELAAHDPADGAERWARTGETLTTVTRELPTADGAVFLSMRRDDSEAFVAVDAADGSDRWRYDGPGESPFVPTGASTHGDVVVGTEYDGLVFGVDAADGAELWTFETEADTRDPPAVVDGTVVVGDTGTVYGLDPADGAELWRVDVAGESPDPVPIEGGVVLVPGDHESTAPFRGFDSEGNELWSYAPEGALSTVSITDGGLFVGTEDGTLLSIGA